MTFEVRVKISKAHIGLTPPIHDREKWRKNVSSSLRGNQRRLGVPHTEETRKRMSDSHIGKKMPEAIKKKISAEALKRWASNEQYAKNVSEGMTRKWAEAGYKERILPLILKANAIRPNKSEAKLLEMLRENFTNLWQYVGDGELIIAGKCPDFWDGNNKLIELFGDYWHKGDDGLDRINLFKQKGYNTLIIWEHELVDSDSLINKIKEFNENNFGAK